MENMIGFTFMLNGIDYFVKTNKKNKTENLAKEILQKLKIKNNPSSIKWLLYRLEKANCDIKHLPDGKSYYDIYGKNFGGHGSFVDDGMTIIIKLE